MKTTILDLPVEEQKRLAKKEGFATLEAWQAHTKEELELMEKYAEEVFNAPPLTREQADELIHDLRTNPGCIEFYRRISDRYELTVEQMIAEVEEDVKRANHAHHQT